MKHRERINLGNMPPPVIEIDTAARSAYVRFRKGAKVAKTKSLPMRQSANVAIDFDASDRIIGIEVIGVTEFSIRGIVRLLPPGGESIDMSRARFIPAASAELAEA